MKLIRAHISLVILGEMASSAIRATTCTAHVHCVQIEPSDACEFGQFARTKRNACVCRKSLIDTSDDQVARSARKTRVNIFVALNREKAKKR